MRMNKKLLCQAAVAALVGILGGCAPQATYDHAPQANASPPSMDLQQARKLLAPYFVRTGDDWFVREWVPRAHMPSPYITTGSIIVRDKSGGAAAAIPLARIEPVVHDCRLAVKVGSATVYEGGKVFGQWSTFFAYPQCGPAKANSMLDALLYLKSVAVRAERAERGRFEQVLASHSASMARPLPEDANRYRVLAEQAVRDKKFDEAADDYGHLLEHAPWWPPAYFNRALVLANIGAYDEGVTEMKRYLALAPGASNARAAQDQIYVWQRRAQQQRGE